jgi:hypothetical protein
MNQTMSGITFRFGLGVTAIIGSFIYSSEPARAQCAEAMSALSGVRQGLRTTESIPLTLDAYHQRHILLNRATNKLDTVKQLEDECSDDDPGTALDMLAQEACTKLGHC